MSRYTAYLHTAAEFVNSYSGGIPFARFIKDRFSKSKKYGSTDRKTISGLCHAFFRVGHAVSGSLEYQILAGWFLISTHKNILLETLQPKWNDSVHLPVEEKLEMLQILPLNLFPFENFISPELNKTALALSVLKQPQLFVRIRPGYEDEVLNKLTGAGIEYSRPRPDTLALPNSTALEKILQVNREVMIQDLNSQRVFEAVSGTLFEHFPPRVWDCCAASGGKTALLHDRFNGNVLLTVSDIRKSILLNLKERLNTAQISIADLFIADLAREKSAAGPFDWIVCDAPCSGSGTWARTPEQLKFFTEEKISFYAKLQRSIGMNVINNLKPGGIFSYITCSVFSRENEDSVAFFLNNTPLKLIDKRYLIGYDCGADTLFSATFQWEK